MKTKVSYWKTIFVLAFSTILVISCGGTRDDSLFIDEESFPAEKGTSEVTSGKKGEQEDLQADEAEVLRLLGITKEEKASSEEKAVPKASGEDAATLQKEISDLSKQVAERERQMETLRTELQARDERISKLEQELRQVKSPLTKAAPQTSVPSSYESGYQHALSLYYDRNYNAAIQEFEQLLSMDNKNSLADNCQYWIGESYYGLGNYQEAIIEFEKVFNYTDSNKYDDAQLKLGLCYMKLGDANKARAEFERLLTNYPDSEYITKAEELLSEL